MRRGKKDSTHMKNNITVEGERECELKMSCRCGDEQKREEKINHFNKYCSCQLFKNFARSSIDNKRMTGKKKKEGQMFASCFTGTYYNYTGGCNRSFLFFDFFFCLFRLITEEPH